MENFIVELYRIGLRKKYCIKLCYCVLIGIYANKWYGN